MFVLNRFRAISGVTPYEAVQGSRYSGKVVKFGETVMARIKQQKGEPRFVAQQTVFSPEQWGNTDLDPIFRAKKRLHF